MPPKYSHIPQSVFPTQQDDEKVFVISRRYFVSFVAQSIILFLFFFVPAIFLILGYAQTVAILSTFPIFVVDAVILLLTVYYLSLISIFIIYFLRFYYSLLIVTNLRIYQIFQRGLFSREIQEFTLDELEEVSFKSRGLIGLIFNVGDISIHLQGQDRDYEIPAVPHANIISFIMASLRTGTKQKIMQSKITPDLKYIGVLDSDLIKETDQPQPIMNFGQSIKKAQLQLKRDGLSPKTFGEKFDLWWWTQLKKEHSIYINYSPEQLMNIAKKEGDGEKRGRS